MPAPQQNPEQSLTSWLISLPGLYPRERRNDGTERMTRRWTEQDRLDQIVTMNAINRLIDSTIRTLEKHPRDADARGNIEDWRACRCTVETLWRQAQEVAYGRGFPR